MSSALATPRLQLLPPALTDVEGLWPHVTSSELTTYLAWEPHQQREETAAMITALIHAQAEGRGFHWVVRCEDAVVGLVSLIDVRRTHRSFTWNRAELACWIGVQHQGKGYATEVCTAAMRYGFGALGLHKIIQYHAAENLSSARLAEKIGFRLVGEERQTFCKHGKWHDTLLYEMLAEDFLPMQPCA
jgi:RimJ/RimL family protein N-acetyltransferase